MGLQVLITGKGPELWQWLLKMAIEIVDLSIKKGDVPYSYVAVYQRLVPAETNDDELEKPQGLCRPTCAQRI